MQATLDKAATLDALPPPWADDLLPGLQSTIARINRKVWILDDDPTGTQTIAGLPVITRWDVTTLQAEFDDSSPACFILTNSRGLTSDQSRDLHRVLMRNLREVAGQRSYGIISRSDSTLRGHYPIETDTIAEGMTAETITLLAPFFAAGGRYTLNDTHYVAEGNQLIPAAATPFARDVVFGYKTSHLPAWVTEKTAGSIAAEDVVCISLQTIRQGGPVAVAQLLHNCPSGGVVITNAVNQSDIEVVVAAVLDFETSGRRVIARTGASYVCARVGQRPPPLLTGHDLANPHGRGGLILVGSHVPKSTAQLQQLKQRHDVTAIELDVTSLLDQAARPALIARSIDQMNKVLAEGRDVVVHTSRELIQCADESSNLSISASVSGALIEVVQRIAHLPRYLIAKGGITSSDIATKGLGVQRAIVRGQIMPGVPVWELGPETKFPGLSYVVFPGNVGDDNAVADAVTKFNSVSS